MPATKKQITANRKNAKKAGRPKGARSFATIEREQMLKLVQQKISDRAFKLINSQTILGMGSIKVFRIDTEIIGSGKNAKRIRQKPVLVEDNDELISVLDYEFAHGESPNDEDTYYFITTKDPENKAITDLLDRTFGKAKESIDLNLVPQVDPELRERANNAINSYLNGRRTNSTAK